jgi:hypothetical protein
MLRIDLSNALQSGKKIVNGAISLLPNVVIALVIFCGFLILGYALKSTVRRVLERRRRHRNIAILLGLGLKATPH